jgi:hypothetical protein
VGDGRTGLIVEKGDDFEEQKGTSTTTTNNFALTGERSDVVDTVAEETFSFNTDNDKMVNNFKSLS